MHHNLGEMKGDLRAKRLEPLGEPGKRTESKRARLPKYSLGGIVRMEERKKCPLGGRYNGPLDRHGG